MQVFSEPENQQSSPRITRRDSNDTTNTIDNTYATIQPRNLPSAMEIGDYATLNVQAPSVKPSHTLK